MTGAAIFMPLSPLFSPPVKTSIQTSKKVHTQVCVPYAYRLLRLVTIILLIWTYMVLFVGTILGKPLASSRLGW